MHIVLGNEYMYSKLFVNLGYNCLLTKFARNCGLPILAFNNIYLPEFKDVIHFLETDFEDFISPDDIVITENWQNLNCEYDGDLILSKSKQWCFRHSPYIIKMIAEENGDVIKICDRINREIVADWMKNIKNTESLFCRVLRSSRDIEYVEHNYEYIEHLIKSFNPKNKIIYLNNLSITKKLNIPRDYIFHFNCNFIELHNQEYYDMPYQQSSILLNRQFLDYISKNFIPINFTHVDNKFIHSDLSDGIYDFFLNSENEFYNKALEKLLSHYINANDPTKVEVILLWSKHKTNVVFDKWLMKGIKRFSEKYLNPLNFKNVRCVNKLSHEETQSINWDAKCLIFDDIMWHHDTFYATICKKNTYIDLTQFVLFLLKRRYNSDEK